MIYFISDLHFGHENIISMDSRPFRNADEMDAELIKRWNNKVLSNDIVYILGDFSWHNSGRTVEILNELKGTKILIKGNHDRISQEVSKCYKEICDYKEVFVNDNHIVLSHYPVMFYKGQYKGWYHFYGHIHMTKDFELMKKFVQDTKNSGITQRAYNVGAMIPYMNFTPRSFQEIIRNNNTLFR